VSSDVLLNETRRDRNGGTSICPSNSPPWLRMPSDLVQHYRPSIRASSLSAAPRLAECRSELAEHGGERRTLLEQCLSLEGPLVGSPLWLGGGAVACRLDSGYSTPSRVASNVRTTSAPMNQATTTMRGRTEWMPRTAAMRRTVGHQCDSPARVMYQSGAIGPVEA
jgi:hypothetical protein